MDRIIISGTGFPGANELLQFQDDSLVKAIEGLSAAVGNSVIFSGIVENEGVLSAGWLIYEGELLPFKESNVGETVVIKEIVTTAAYDNTQSGDFDQIAPVWKTRHCEIGDAGDADVAGTFPFADLERINTLQELSGIDQATEDKAGIAEIATQAEANGTDDDLRIVTPKKLNDRTATTNRRGVVELLTVSETVTGNDNERVPTIKTLRDAGYRITKVTTGVLLMENQVSSLDNNSNDFSKNYGFVYPPTGFTMDHFVSIHLSFNYASYGPGADVNGDDKQWLNHQTDGDKVTIIGNLSENALNTKLNYSAIWQK